MPTYYYLDADHQQQGPVSEAVLCEQLLTPDLYVWTDGLSQWTKAKDVPALQSHLVGTPPPIPPSPLSPPLIPEEKIAIVDNGQILLAEEEACGTESIESSNESKLDWVEEHTTSESEQPSPMQTIVDPEAEMPPCPPTYLALGILATVLCCPIGAFALFASNKVERLYAEGFYDEAERKSKLARNLCILSFVLTIVCFVVYVACVIETMSKAPMLINSSYYY